MRQSHAPSLLNHLAKKYGTPFWIYDAGALRDRIGKIRAITDTPNVQARYAMKACPATRRVERNAGE